MSSPYPNGLIKLDGQRRFWNTWNAQHRTSVWKLPNVNSRQAEIAKNWFGALGHDNFDILEIGGRARWLCEQQVGLGTVTGTDLANEVSPSTSGLPGQPVYIAGDFFDPMLPPSSFDVVVSLEMLAHIDDQHACIAKIVHLLRPGAI